MITWVDLYTVLSAVVPLYVAMILAYGSVKWWKVFTPDQCSGINRFVAIFAVPLLSFHFISTNDLYGMHLRFIAADTLQKLIVLVGLTLWLHLTPHASLEWLITIFSLSTQPNTLVMGIPLLIAMYGRYAGELMVQLVVLQCIVWYTLLLFLFEFRAARTLILDQFPAGAAKDIVSFRVDTDVVSLDAGGDFLQAETEPTPDGKFRVVLRKSTSSRRSFSGVTPRPSNLTGAEIYSLSSTPRCSNFTSGEPYSLHSSIVPTPRPSNFDDHNASTANHHDAKELHMFVWSSTASPASGNTAACNDGAKEIRMFVPVDPPKSIPGGETLRETPDTPAGEDDRGVVIGNRLPPASVMTRLILIMVWRKLIRNPNTYSSLVGVVWALIAFRWNVEIPEIVKKSISILSDAGLGMAMFSLGIFMALQPRIIACGNKTAAFAMAVRFLTGPAVMAAASIAVGLHGTIFRVAIVGAALPQGIVPFVFAKEYSVHPAILSTAVIFGMLIALPITLLYYILLGL